MAMCCIYDKKTNVYHPPFITQNSKSAMRTFNNVVKNDKFMSDNSEDYDCMQIGTYDDSTGKVIDIENIYLCNGKFGKDTIEDGNNN